MRRTVRRTVKRTVLVLVFLILSVSTGYLAYLHFFAEKERDLSGEWTAYVDMTEQAAAEAACWLQDIEAVSVSLEDMESYMQGLTVSVGLTMEQTARNEGTFCCGILPESYADCEAAAYEAFAGAFRDLVAERLRMAGYTGGTDGEAVEALVTETFGMSTVSYLRSCVPGLLPSLEEMQAEYDGSGVYKAAEGILTRQFTTGQSGAVKEERYLCQGLYLILYGEADADALGLSLQQYPVVYTLMQAGETGKEEP